MVNKAGEVRPVHRCVFYAGERDIGALLEYVRPAIGQARQPLVLFGPPGMPASLRRALHEHFPDQAFPAVILVECDSDPDAMVELAIGTIRRLVDEGAEWVRLLALAGWDVPGWPAPEDYLWAEARITESLGDLPAEVICGYDVTSLPGAALIYSGLEAHSLISIGHRSAPCELTISATDMLRERIVNLPWLRGPRRLEVERGIHACAFFLTRDEEYATLVPLIRDGYASGQAAVHIVDTARREDHARRLAAAGLLSSANEGHAPVIRDWSETYLVDRRFEADRMLGVVRGLLYGSDTGTRLIADMAWALTQPPGVDALIEYEEGINETGPRPLDTVICTYDSARFGGATVLDILRAHPMVILGGVLQDNGLYVPSGVLIEEVRQRKAEHSA
jgi:hypothetical protein